MKIIKYDLCTLVNCGTVEQPAWEQVLSPVELEWSEANEAIAAAEAYNGEYTIEDDGVEPEAEPSLESRVVTLEEDSSDMKQALEMILTGVTE